ncbi:hypothetical protein NP493_404g00006 [Ridgeia piscesae]|uniref:Uncharacterized protein n=1 Tax=Ridgeia piscesae TaxID=27915 RepID=A0AAD9NSL2_RIDPI|nr:hypothetical protein NP493_404g00006 [Ridgeia piscesae]
MGNANTNATVTNSVAQFSHVATATATPAAGTASAHHSDILTPTLVIPQAAPQDTIHEPTINLADFEREENPFDEVELKTINDMEVLHDVLLPTLPAQNGLVPAGTGNSIHNDPGLTGGQTVPLPDIPATRCLVQTSQTVNALPQSTAQHMSASYPQRMPTPFVSTTNQDSVQIYSTGSVRYSPPSGGRTSMSHPLKSSRSSPDISNNTSHAAPRVMPEPPVYTPPRHPSHTPPPRPSHLQVRSIRSG